MNGGIVILGAGGHGRVVLDICIEARLPVAGFLDSGQPVGSLVDGVAVLGGDILLDDPAFVAAHRFLPAVGSQSVRRRLAAAVTARGGILAVAIHPAAAVSRRAELGPGSVVMATAAVNPGTRAGAYCIVNTGATIDHDCALGDGVQVGPGAHLGGTVTCGEDVYVGIGASIIHGVTVGAGAVIGAGAAVIHDVAPGATVVGVPARPL